MDWKAGKKALDRLFEKAGGKGKARRARRPTRRRRRCSARCSITPSEARRGGAGAEPPLVDELQTQLNIHLDKVVASRKSGAGVVEVDLDQDNGEEEEVGGDFKKLKAAHAKLKAEHAKLKAEHAELKERVWRLEAAPASAPHPGPTPPPPSPPRPSSPPRPIATTLSATHAAAPSRPPASRLRRHSSPDAGAAPALRPRPRRPGRCAGPPRRVMCGGRRRRGGRPAPARLARVSRRAAIAPSGGRCRICSMDLDLVPKDQRRPTRRAMPKMLEVVAQARPQEERPLDETGGQNRKPKPK